MRNCAIFSRVDVYLPKAQGAGTAAQRKPTLMGEPAEMAQVQKNERGDFLVLLVGLERAPSTVGAWGTAATL